MLRLKTMDTLLQDLRYAVRTLANNPGFTALTIVCLALGIGVNSTMFSVVDTVEIRPLPFRDPARLVAIDTTKPGSDVTRDNVSYPDWQDWKARTHSFEELAGVGRRSLTLSDKDEPERFTGATITPIWASAAMTLSSVSVIGNALRLRRASL